MGGAFSKGDTEPAEIYFQNVPAGSYFNAKVLKDLKPTIELLDMKIDDAKQLFLLFAPMDDE